MARKSLGKMEFAQLIDSLKEQNQNQLEAQQQTTKKLTMSGNVLFGTI